ncbi:MAG: hypothetical protein K5804_17850 [Microbacterium sp.]|uniref:hypothetical protein n=1 Tax=Microbacterium sp. TaxID=51671 RepID=UPI00260F9143|nr:hypothetical protein [Microbacterium sp.]MCV0420109.1 hypothetical protein [Microbacterium sp.]
MITADQLRKYESAGVVAAARALHLHTTTIHRLALQLGVTFKTCTEREQYRREKVRKGLAGKIRALALKRMSQREICEQLGITRCVLRHTAAEHRINIDSRSLG